MPKYEDLKFLRDKILKLGNEIEIKEQSGEKIDTIDLPEQITITDQENKDDIDNIIEGLLDDIQQDKEAGLIKSEEEDLISLEDLNQQPVDSHELNLDDISFEEPSNESEDWDKLKEDSIENLDFDNVQNDKIEGPKDESFNEIGDLLSSLNNVNVEEIEEEEKKGEIEKKQEIKNKIEEKEEEHNDLISLAGDFANTKVQNNEEDSLENFLMDMASNQETIETTSEPPPDFETLISPIHKDLVDLAGEFSTENNQQDNLFIDHDILNIGEQKEVSKDEIKEKGIEKDSIVSENIEMRSSPSETPVENIQIENQKKESEADYSVYDVEPVEEVPVVEEIKEESIIEPIVSEEFPLEEIHQEEEKKETISSTEEFDFGNLDEFSVSTPEEIPPINVDESSISEIESIESQEEKVEQKIDESQKDQVKFKQKESISGYGPDEIELTDDEIKQIVITLSTLPKEAELKIAKEIVSDKYTDQQLKPLIDSLIEKESPQAIIKIYEKITGDKSLSKVTGVKYTGQEFEEKQKSIVYLFQKNILPVVSKIAAATLFLLCIVILFLKIIYPTMEATKYYNLGKKNIDEKRYNEVEKYFKKAYEIQPRYNEVLIYARKYRNNKIYLESERKYDLAYSMKPSRKLKLEIADFFTEIEDFERSVLNYKELIRKNNKDIDALLGLANTYFVWSKKENNKLELAKNIYYDILDINPKNKKALLGQLNVFISERNSKEILKFYKYIDKNFKSNIDPYVYANLANYFIETGDLTDIRKILETISKRAKNEKLIMPEINYLYAKYKKYLNILNEEKNHLENCIKDFENLKINKPELYGTNYYQRMLSSVYNDLGENYDRFSKANIKAEENYIKAIQIDPTNGKAYYNLGNFSLKYKVDYRGSLNNYLEAEKNGFSNDRLNYNVGWIYYKEQNYLEAFKRINKLLEKFPDNNNLKLFNGTIFYKLGNYDYSEALLLEVYNHYKSLNQINSPLDMSIKEHREIVDMLMKSSNNLGATYQKKYERTKNSNYIIWATKYYADSIQYFDKFKEYHFVDTNYETQNTYLDIEELKLKKFQITDANQNLRMILYPDVSKGEPILFEDFTLDYEISL